MHDVGWVHVDFFAEKVRLRMEEGTHDRVRRDTD
jgi:hypothetical protein